MKVPATTRLLLVGVLGWGCAYYNGLYNANQLAKEATRARREGRPGEARAHWEEVALKAESVAIRFPRSKYRDDALLLQGRALIETGHCDRAVAPLGFASDSSQDPALRRQAQLLLGECHVRLGSADQARTVLSPLVADPDATVSRTARLWRARAALARADYAGALDDLSAVGDTVAEFDRAVAMIGLGEVSQAANLLTRVEPGRYDEAGWLGALERLGGASPADASTLVDSLLSRGNISPGQRARLLLADAERWKRAGDQQRSVQRLDQAVRVAPDSTEGRLAQVRLAIARLERARDPNVIPEVIAQLRAAAANGGDAANLAAPVLEILGRLTEQRSPSPDLFRFVAIEAVRDSLNAPSLAAALFRRFQQEFPRSPVAPKALLAAVSLDPDSSAGLMAILDSLYPSSPYRLALQGRGDPAFAAVEDSIRAVLDSGAIQRPRPAAPLPRPGTGRQIPEP